MRVFYLFLFLVIAPALNAQADRWQQAAKYQMDVDMDDANHQFTGTQKLEYTNNSPEKLHRVFYHLYFNAFQPGSMMDVRSLTIEDPDPRVGDRISKLTPEQQGYLHVTALTLNGKKVDFEEVGTILEVQLKNPIEAGQTVTFEMEFNGQVPLQIRRSGRQNKEGIAYSMSQWYPKMCEFDYEGWHANPYVGREFHGIWGDFEVNITIDNAYVLGGTGIVTNGDDVGHGYQSASTPPMDRMEGEKVTWKFLAENVHDFVWAADKDYVHKTASFGDGQVMHFLYQNMDEYKASWEKLVEDGPKAFDYLSERFGKYPYPQYSVIQGGDGGMEYPMATLVTGNRSAGSLLSVFVHEGAHSWYHGVLATNEALYEWMDEGFTSYATAEAMAYMRDEPLESCHRRAYGGYFYIVKSETENPMTTHADHYATNTAYGQAAYSKGETLLAQLRYVIGVENVEQGLLKYFDTWKYKHPNPTDFKRIMECQSGLELDWYFEYFEKSTRTIDYAIDEIKQNDGKVAIQLSRVGMMPMPIDIDITYTDGSVDHVYIPMVIMRGEKPEVSGESRIVKPDWPWVEPNYSFEMDDNGKTIASVQIDPMRWMADVDRGNNGVDFSEGVLFQRP